MMTMMFRPTSESHFPKAQPLRLPGPNGWVLREITNFSSFIGKYFVYDSKKYPHLYLEVIEKHGKSYFDKSVYFVANIRNRFGVSKILYTENFKSFSKVFSSSSFKSSLNFYENQEIEKETVNNKRQKTFLGTPIIPPEEKVYNWITELANGRKILWYSNYDCVIYPNENLPEFQLEDGIKKFVPYKVEKREGRTYVHFEKPIKAYVI